MTTSRSSGVSNLASKLGQMGPKLNESGTFPDQFHTFCETDLKKSQICPIWAKLDAKYDMPVDEFPPLSTDNQNYSSHRLILSNPGE